MKKWNTPEVAELNIAETANGIFPADIETIVLWDKKECEKPGSGNNDGDNEDVTSPLS